MTTCHCDGPPHTYSPGWCRAGRGNDGKPINKSIAAAQMELRAAQMRAEAEAERDAALAVIEQVQGWCTENQMHEIYQSLTDQPEECTDECEWCPLDTILATSPPDALDAVKAAAWDEGHEVGGSNYGLGDIDANPYRPRTPGEETT